MVEMTAVSQEVASNDLPTNYLSPEWSLVWATLILAFITFVLAIFTYRLWRATKELAKDAEETSRQQAKDMQRSLAIAEKHANAVLGVELPRFVRHSVNFSLRVTDALEATLQDYLREDYIVVTIRNIGRSDAEITHINLVIQTAEMLHERPRYPFNSNIAVSFGTIVQAGNTYPIRSNTPISLTPDLINDLIHHRTKLWVYGFIRYKDFIQDSHRFGFGVVLEITETIDGLDWRFLDSPVPGYNFID